MSAFSSWIVLNGRCELDRLRKQHEETLANSSIEATKSHQAQLEASQSSYQHSVATRDATIAALKDEVDQQRLAHQEEVEAWQRKYQDLESQLAEAKCQVSRILKVLHISVPLLLKTLLLISS